MDFLTSKRFITAILAILVVLNMTLLGILWWQNIHKPERKPVRITRQYSRHVYFKEPLSLSEEQSLRFREIRKEHFRKVMPDIQARSRLKKELIAESVKEKPDTARIAALAASIGSRQAVIEKELALHFHELAMVCTPAQRDSLRNILERISSRKVRFRTEKASPSPDEIREVNIIREER
ncbi:MAG: periplasmic heavy metal sensor [Chlorobi bacterium]|nr:periplasmic heavy metal sensor [Chlorobiota bacterium]